MLRDRLNAFRWVSFFLVVAFLGVACGQKEGIHAFAPTGGPFVPGVTPTDASGSPLPGQSLPPGATPGVGPTGGSTVTPTGPAAPPPGGGDRTGIFDDRIVIGLHAPETGAAPIQSAVFDAGKDLYWKWLREVKKQDVFGRRVEVVTADDQYSPTTAVSVCNKMATQDKAFLLIGGAGTDQINACANFADQRGIPYLSPGVQEAGLSTRRTYFAVTMTYRAQMAPLVQLLKKENAGDALGGLYGTDALKIGFVRPNTPNFDDADQALAAAASAAGFEYEVYSVVKEGNSTEAKTVAQQMQQDEVDVAVPITAPTFTTQLAINTGSNNYKPRYAGVAISNNINQMINLACDNNQFERALFLSPWPGWKQVMEGKYDPDFEEAAQRFAAKYNHRDKGGDLLLALWGIMKTLHQMFLAAGEDMSRESFVETMHTFRYSPGAFPDVQYQVGNPFGAKNAFVLRGSCSEPAPNGYPSEGGEQWITHPSYTKKYSSF